MRSLACKQPREVSSFGYHNHERNLIVEGKLHGLRAKNLSNRSVFAKFSCILLCVCCRCFMVKNAFGLNNSFRCLYGGACWVRTNACFVREYKNIATFERCS